jgi:adenylate cyclase
MALILEYIADALVKDRHAAPQARAYRLLAEIDNMRGRTDLALEQSKRAIEINPNDAESCATRGEMLMFAGRAEEGVSWLKDALRLDPTAARADFLLGMAYYFMGRYGEAVEVMSQGLTGNLGRTIQVTGRTVLAATYAQLNRMEDAERERIVVMRMSPFLNAERFAAQFGTQQARDHMLEGLKKAGFR